MRVLVIEDDEASISLLQHRLSTLSCEVVVAETAAEGVRLASTERPSLILADLHLDGELSQGIEMLRRLRTDLRTADIPIVLHSAHADVPEARALSDAALAKPSSFSDLREIIAVVQRASDGSTLPRSRPSDDVKNEDKSKEQLILELERTRDALSESGVRARRAEIDLYLLERAIEASATSIVITGPNKRDNPILFVNPAFEALTGYSKDEALGRNCRFLQGAEPRSAAVQEIGQAVREGRNGRALLRNYRKDGSAFWNELSISPVHDVNGRVSHFIGVQNDVTEREETLAARDRLALERIALLEEADAMKDQFLGILSHELRTPINALMGFGSVLQDEIPGSLNAEQHRYIRKMLGGADVLLGLVNDLLEMSRIQAGKFSLETRPTEFPGLVKEVLETMAPLADQKAQQLVNEVPAELPPLQADAQRLSQVLTNLLSNAIKFTPEGGTLRVRAQPDGGWLRCEVEDSGVGIAEADRPRLFQRFSQLDTTNTRGFGGTGLGLAISKALVEAHGGEIGLASAPGGGCVFYFTVPFAGYTPGPEG